MSQHFYTGSVKVFIPLLRARNGKDVFEDLERRVAIYNNDNKSTSGKAVVKRLKMDLMLAICTPL